MLSLPIRPLRDRMEIIPIAGYSLEDKLPIAKRLINCRIQSETNLFANYFFTSGIFCPDKGNNMALRKKMSKWMRRWWRSWSKATPKRLESGEDIFWKSQYCNLMFHCFQDPWEATGSIVQGCGSHSGWRGEGEKLRKTIWMERWDVWKPPQENYRRAHNIDIKFVEKVSHYHLDVLEIQHLIEHCCRCWVSPNLAQCWKDR